MTSYDKGIVIMVWILAAGWMLPQIPSSASADPPSLDRATAIATALRFNPQVQAARSQVQALTARTTQANAGLLPQLDVSETFSNTNTPLGAFGTKLNQGTVTSQDFNPGMLNDPDAINNYRTALTLSWHLFDGGNTWIGRQQARMNESAGQLALTRTQQQTIAQTATAYAGCLLTRENREVVDQALKTAQAHLKVVEDRQRSGLAVKSDVLRAQVRIADLRQQLLQAESSQRVALAMLGAAMGKPDMVTEGMHLTTRIDDAAPFTGNLASWLTRAQDRSDLKQLELLEQVALKQVDRAQTGHYPTLALQGNYEINTEDFSDTKDGYAVGAVLKVNVFSGQRISGQSAEARAALARISAMRDGLALGVRVDTQKAFYEAQSAWQSIEVARSAVAQAEEGLRIVANRYQNGLLPLVSLLDAQVALQEAQTRHFKALHDYNVARIALALAGGVIDKNFR
ncbi:MAG: TolC family protein [Desulfatitalea sp.]|nr:TolC family protein [Desulfatitalea sp.]NNK02109.1 TolC family protein [Desulfatitalea sp.]